SGRLCVGNFARSKSACGDYPDHVAHFPSSTRLLSLWPGLPVAASVFGADLSRPAIRSTTPVTAADIALHRPCHAQGLQWGRHAPGVQFSRDLLDRLHLDRASSGGVSVAKISLNRSQADNRRSHVFFSPHV